MESGEDAMRKYKKGSTIEVFILGIDSERERISLGIKQLDELGLSTTTESEDEQATKEKEESDSDDQSAEQPLADDNEAADQANHAHDDTTSPEQENEDDG